MALTLTCYLLENKEASIQNARPKVMQKHVTLIQMLISQRTYYVLDFHSQVQHVHFKNVDQCKNPPMAYAIFHSAISLPCVYQVYYGVYGFFDG